MSTSSELELQGHSGRLSGRRWGGRGAVYVVLLCHGYGEHVGRYDRVADRLVRDGAAVYGVDHVGHGRSEGERALITDFEWVVEDFRQLEKLARAEHPGLPVVLVGHSMGGMIVARYAQRYGSGLAAVVLSGPVLGEWATVDTLLAAEEIPDTFVDPATLSRDPAVGEAYVADPLVWHGPFKRPTLEALRAGLTTIDEAGAIGLAPVLWLHGAEDALVPYAGTAKGWVHVAGPDAEAKVYPGARHEIFNETNADVVLDDVLEFVHRHVRVSEPSTG